MNPGDDAMTFSRNFPFSAAVALLALQPGTAEAQCVPNFGATPPTLQCSGSDTDQDVDVDGLEVTVDAGSSVLSGSDDAMRLRGDDNTLINNGLIQTSGNNDEAVQADGDTFTLANSGRIETTGAGDKAVQAEEFGTTVTNSGQILAITEGIEAGNGFTLNNLSGAIIAADEDAVQFGGGTLINAAGASITGGRNGNDGDGVDMDFGLVENAGVIQSLGAGSAGIDIDEVDIDDNPITDLLTIRNSGTISGEIGILVEPDLNGGPNNSAQHVHNSGTISGLDGMAITLAAGDDRVWLESGSLTEGDIDLGAGADALFLSAGIATNRGSLFDGGDGLTDLLGFEGGILSSEVSFTATGANAFDLNFDSSQFKIANFEFFDFRDGRFLLDATGALAAVAPVPLPAGLPLLLAGLGGLALMRRRKARAT